MKRLDVINIMAVLSLVLPPLLGSLAAQRSADGPAALDEATVHAYGDRDKTCSEWTDGCRTCSRSDAGEPICSNIGIACEPKAIVCVRRQDAAPTPKQEGAPK
jgi:hypothetical protein